MCFVLLQNIRYVGFVPDQDHLPYYINTKGSQCGHGIHKTLLKYTLLFVKEKRKRNKKKSLSRDERVGPTLRHHH